MTVKLVLGLVYLAVTCGFYAYIIATAQPMPKEMEEALRLEEQDTMNKRALREIPGGHTPRHHAA